MLNELEKLLLEHNALLTLSFTLALVVSGLATAIATYLNVRELKKSLLIQENIFLKSELIYLNKIKYDLEYALHPDEKRANLVEDTLDLIRKEIYQIIKTINEKK